MNFSPKWNARSVARWEKTRAKGRTRFVIVRGVLGWGVSTSLLATLIDHFLFKSHETMRPTAVNLAVYPLGGIFFGYWMWTYLENAYQRHLSQKELNALDAFNPKP